MNARRDNNVVVGVEVVLKVHGAAWQFHDAVQAEIGHLDLRHVFVGPVALESDDKYVVVARDLDVAGLQSGKSFECRLQIAGANVVCQGIRAVVLER